MNNNLFLPPLTAEQLSVIAASLLAILFDHLPKLAAAFDQWSAAKKRALMALLTLLAAFGAQGLACAGLTDTGLACDKAGFAALIALWLGAITANQATHLIAKPGARG